MATPQFSSARLSIGTPQGCIDYSPEELAVLESILQTPNRFGKNMIVHRALRVYCQMIVKAGISGHFPGSLGEFSGLGGHAQKGEPDLQAMLGQNAGHSKRDGLSRDEENDQKSAMVVPEDERSVPARADADMVSAEGSDGRDSGSSGHDENAEKKDWYRGRVNALMAGDV